MMHMRAICDVHMVYMMYIGSTCFVHVVYSSVVKIWSRSPADSDDICEKPAGCIVIGFRFRQNVMACETILALKQSTWDL